MNKHPNISKFNEVAYNQISDEMGIDVAIIEEVLRNLFCFQIRSATNRYEELKIWRVGKFHLIGVGKMSRKTYYNKAKKSAMKSIFNYRKTHKQKRKKKD